MFYDIKSCKEQVLLDYYSLVENLEIIYHQMVVSVFFKLFLPGSLLFDEELLPLGVILSSDPLSLVLGLRKTAWIAPSAF